ncbi:Cytochrome c oxidase polypeptide 5, mitochondrial [Talaromyces atroroseus]|uniref:Cytochrome c oxidase polypeptide V n=1 Tax=Talaromyces atroroseus TaxID=1441469 RepID=A0A225ALJ6_TALAT|nr:Cytochrome c oxidase polypeptide 5, mitochondrial [Talaromyces atroroseus]OKL55796.1 Cytochrome c oxidase polypeptide 5, mitochondrial [Talaromyces atroroseus]
MFVRTASQAVRSSAARASVTPMARVAAQQTRSASEHAIANPTLAGIEKRWEALPPQEQADLWMQLRDRMKVDWHEMTLQEKKAAYWIAFGAHGPRKEAPKGEGWKIASKVVQLVAVSVGLFYTTRLFAKPPPRTMTKEWQEASNEYALKENIEPITGISSQGYQGVGYVQSPPEKSS